MVGCYRPKLTLSGKLGKPAQGRAERRTRRSVVPCTSLSTHRPAAPGPKGGLR